LPLVEKGNKRLDVWNGGTLSIAGRSTLINASLTNSPIYHMSVYLLPKSTISSMDKTRRTFFWQGGGTKKKYHLIKWETICKNKKKGGLRIKDLRKLNISLMCKWWWRLETEEGLWQEIVKYKYLKNKSIHEVSHRLNDSPIWADLLKVKDIYLQGRSVSFGKGNLTRFWLEPWVYKDPLYLSAPLLFELCENKEITVAHFLKGSAITFRRWLFDDLRTSWNSILQDTINIQVVDRDDTVLWKIGKKGKFTVKSVYDALTNSHTGIYHKRIWKGNIP
jgi:hypothetical protein